MGWRRVASNRTNSNYLPDSLDGLLHDPCMPDTSQEDMYEWKDSGLMLSLDWSSATCETEFYSHLKPYVGSLENVSNMELKETDKL